MIGKVIEVFIPANEDEIMNSTKIGFKVLCEDKIIEIIEDQNDDNALIFKNDLVYLSEENNKLTIELLGEINE